jgi:radial spoke head protein 1
VYTDGAAEETNWIKRSGSATVTYLDGSTFTGTFDSEKLKQGLGTYVWMSAGEGDDSEEKVQKGKYVGNYVDGKKNGRGKCTFPSGDTYDGYWLDNTMDGEGTYVYKLSGDVYSGSFAKGKKNGQGRYEYGKDESQLVGDWVDGTIVSGKWELKGAGVYEGTFKNGKPNGEGSFAFNSGIVQKGKYVATKKEGEEEEENAAGDIKWDGENVFSTV